MRGIHRCGKNTPPRGAAPAASAAGLDTRRRVAWLLVAWLVVAGLVVSGVSLSSSAGVASAHSRDSTIVAQAAPLSIDSNDADTTGAASTPGVPDGPTPQQAAALDLIPNPAPRFVAVHIDAISPHVADGSVGTNGVGGVPIVTVDVTLENRSTVPVHDIAVRLQRGAGDVEPARIRTGLHAPETDFPIAGPFEDVIQTLAPGAQIQHTVSLPLSAVPPQAQLAPQPSLAVTEPGVYPLLVNVNGTPDGLGPVLLDTARTLLPVLPGALRDLPRASAGAKTPARAVPLTMLYPIAAPPTRRASVPGIDGPEPAVHLGGSRLLTELAPDGRLSGLLDALEDAEEQSAALRSAICVALDPETLRTVDDIAAGMPVKVDGGSDPKLLDDARGYASVWLDRVRALVAGHCVVALPPAQVDLAAVAATDSAALTEAVRDGPLLEVQRIVQAEPLPDVVVPPTGTLPANRPADGAPPLAPRAIIAASAVRTATGAIPRSGVIGLDDGTSALTYDPYLGAALAATGPAPEQPRYSAPEQRYWVQADSAEARMQDARAAAVAPVLATLAEESPGAQGADGSGDGASNDAGGAGAAGAATEPRNVLVVPPQVWDVDGVSAASFLDVLATQLDSGAMRAVPLTEALAAAPVAQGPAHLATAELGAPITSDTLGQKVTGLSEIGAPYNEGIPDIDPGAIDIATIGRLREALNQLATLRSVVDTDDPSAARASAFLDPLRSEALQALTVTGRRSGGDGTIGSLETQFGQSGRESGPTTGRQARSRATESVQRLEGVLTQSFAEIELLPPGTVYQMASPNSPLLLVARNGLPFPIRVGVTVDSPAGIHVDTAGQIAVPTAGSRTVQLPAQTSTKQGKRTVITMQLVTARGTPISQPVQISVQSGGSRIALIFTIGALVVAAALVLRRFIAVRLGREARAATTTTGNDSAPSAPNPQDERQQG